MFKVILGFVAGVFYGVFTVIDTPHGLVAHVATMLKIIWESLP